MTAPPARFRRALEQPTLEWVGLLAILAVAAVLRLVDLPTRGTFDADQGHDMLVLHDLVANGRIPLLGPPTSIGDFHHGVLYYFLLAPAAWLSGSDPVGVTTAIALAGVAAVGVVFWLARSIGGPLAGAVAALLMAVSTSAVDEATFIWNPNLIALTSAIALAAAWRAWSTGRSRWWIVAGIGAIATMHCHVLGSILLVPIFGFLLADARRRGPGPERRAILRAGGIALVLLALSYVPLAIHEFTSDFSEIRAAIAFIAGGGGPSQVGLPVRIGIVAWRVLAWPITGLITDAPAAAMLGTILVLASLGWRAGRAGGASDAERTAVRWFAASLAWTVVALAVGASGLAEIVRGLPNDHYHAFADPIVFVVVGLGIAGLARVPVGGVVPRAAAVVLTIAVVGFNIARQPPAVAADGGWPAAEAAAGRVIVAAGGREIRLAGLPVFKSTEAVAFPLLRLGRPAATQTADPAAPPGDAATVVLCDALFNVAIGAECGGPAEDASVAGVGVSLADRFEAAPGRWISVYLPG